MRNPKYAIIIIKKTKTTVQISLMALAVADPVAIAIYVWSGKVGLGRSWSYVA